MAIVSKSIHSCCAGTLPLKGGCTNCSVIYSQRSEGTGQALGLLIWFAYLTIGARPKKRQFLFQRGSTVS